MERDPDIAVLAARFGLRHLTYRTFERPSFPAPSAVTADEPVDVPPAAAIVATPEPLMPARPPQPVMPPPAMPSAATMAPMPPAAAAPPMHFPLLMQALSRQAVAPAPASAQPFLNLRHVLAETSPQAEH